MIGKQLQHRMLLVREGPAWNRKSTTLHHSLHSGHMSQPLKIPVQHSNSKKEQREEREDRRITVKLNLALAHRGISAVMPIRGGWDAAQNSVQPSPGQVKGGCDQRKLSFTVITAALTPLQYKSTVEHRGIHCFSTTRSPKDPEKC